MNETHELSAESQAVLDECKPPVVDEDYRKLCMTTTKPEPVNPNPPEPTGWELEALNNKPKTEAVAKELAAKFNMQVPLCDGSGRYAIPGGPIIYGRQAS